MVKLSHVELVGCDWLQQLCLMNIYDITKQARNIYFILIYFRFISFYVKRVDGLMLLLSLYTNC